MRFVPKFVGRLYGCTREMIKAPLYVVKDVGEQLYQDTVRIKRSGFTAGVVGGTIAGLTYPVAPVIMPLALAARAAKSVKPVKLAVLAGMSTACIAMFLFAHYVWIAVALYVVEVLALAARADEKAMKMAEKAVKTIIPDEDLVFVGGRPDLGTY